MGILSALPNEVATDPAHGVLLTSMGAEYVGGDKDLIMLAHCALGGLTVCARVRNQAPPKRAENRRRTYMEGSGASGEPQAPKLTFEGNDRPALCRPAQAHPPSPVVVVLFLSLWTLVRVP